MRIFTLPTFWTIVVDTAAWFLIHMGVSAVVTHVPRRFFSPSRFPFRFFFWETEDFYAQRFFIKKWKEHLPDAAPWFGGFSKKSLHDRSLANLNIFIQETCRGEAAHWLIVAFSPLFFLWNIPWVGWLMIVFGLAFNAPCLLVQRYNRGRLQSLVQRIS